MARVEGMLRSALMELATSAGADPTKPQQVSRQLRLNRGLAWKMARIVQGRTMGDIIDHVPGTAGVEILVETLTKGGGSADAAARTREAFREFDQLVERHAGDRQTLALMVSNTGEVQDDRDRLADMRRLAYQGNTAILGIRARVQVSAHIIAPNAKEPAWVDSVRVGGLVDLHRVRGDAHWTLFRNFSYHDDGTASDGGTRALDPECAAELGVPLVREFCSQPLPRLVGTRDGDESLVELPPGPVGQTGAITCFQGSYTERMAPAFRDARDSRGELGNGLRTPVEDLIFDVFVHRSLLRDSQPAFDVYSTMDRMARQAEPGRARNRLPTSESPVRLGTGLAAASTPYFPKYEGILATVFRKVSWNAGDFLGYRVHMAFPPIPALAVISFPLPELPSGKP